MSWCFLSSMLQSNNYVHDKCPRFRLCIPLLYTAPFHPPLLKWSNFRQIITVGIITGRKRLTGILDSFSTLYYLAKMLQTIALSLVGWGWMARRSSFKRLISLSLSFICDRSSCKQYNHFPERIDTFCLFWLFFSVVSTLCRRYLSLQLFASVEI